ncbi:AAA family ATPase [Chryseobacterium sp.]|uniref:AAA family ATPase n=1 Tax=Chryseobacterium sp. TaxID=1871047 RepID=UPI0011C7C9EE|nr:ATP-binding protein [Chryseobacterium sp.]TXF77789.1 AAA family ATPase [Chryseobacterium sp.]
MNLINDLTLDFVQLARIGLAGRQQDIQLLLQRFSKKYNNDYPEMAFSLSELLRESPSKSTPLRKSNSLPLPVDIDSRLQLIKIDGAVLDNEIILSKNIEESLNQVILERDKIPSLAMKGLHPTKSILFTGPPGVGKTMAAKWIASKMERPLLVLDLAAVMSSYLGKTGNNIRYVLEYAKNMDCVLLLDELDSIAKRRDDSSEIGELKRLVTVLLQEIDDWPSSGMLIAATNHPDLLDPAVWRRFEMVLEFENPSIDKIKEQINNLLFQDLGTESITWSEILSFNFLGKSFSEIERQINLYRKSAIIENVNLVSKLEMAISTKNMTKDDKADFACALYKSGVVSQRKAHEITGVARETIRKRATANKKN